MNTIERTEHRTTDHLDSRTCGPVRAGAGA